MAFNNEIEEVKAQLKVLEKKLALLEELEKTKSPVEEAYKRVYGKYPVKEVSENLTAEDNWNVISWSAFQDGYIASQKDYKVGEFQETAQERGERVHNEMEETIRIHDGYGVVDYKPTPQTPVEEAYKDWWGEYPGDENWTSDATRWQGFQAGYNAAYEEKVAQEPEEEPEELKTLYQMLDDKKHHPDTCVFICDIVKEWMSQYTHNVMTGEYLKGYEECLTVLEENLK